MAQSLYLAKEGRYKMGTIKEIREIYFEGMAQRTFSDLFTDEDLEHLKMIGFRNFRGYQNAAVVKYIIEEVGRVPPQDR